MEFAEQITLLLHFIGLGLLITVQVSSFIISRQYKKAPDLQTKRTLLRVMRPIGLLSPVALVIMIVSGIGNMQVFQITLSDNLWLKIKLTLFVIASIIGIVIGIFSKKRGTLVELMIEGKAAAGSEQTLTKYDKLIELLASVTPLLLLAILSLSIYGRLGG